MLGKTAAVFVSLSAGIAPQVGYRLLSLAFDEIGTLACPSVSVLQVLDRSLGVLVVGVIVEGVVVMTSSNGLSPIEVGMHAWSGTHRQGLCRFSRA